MSPWQFVFLALVFLVTSVIGVVTGSNSLITVPVMFQMGMDEKVAVATNMFGLVFMAVGGAIPFIRAGTVSFKGLSPLIILTVAGSALGAAIVGLISNQSIKIIVTVGMIAIVVFTVSKSGPKRVPDESVAGAAPLRVAGKASIAGLVLMYTGAFRIGDRVKVGDAYGDIVEMALLATRVRTIKNEDVTIPNSIVLGTPVTNYSRQARTMGLIINKSVTIG